MPYWRTRHAGDVTGRWESFTTTATADHHAKVAATSTAGDFHVFVTNTEDGQDGASSIRFNDRIHSGIQSRADECFNTCQCQFLELRIGNVDDFGDKGCLPALGQSLHP